MDTFMERLEFVFLVIFIVCVFLMVVATIHRAKVLEANDEYLKARTEAVIERSEASVRRWWK